MQTQIEKQHIVKSPGVRGGKPRIDGTRITVSDVVIWHETQGKSPDEIVADFPHLSLAGVYAALSYYHDHQEEIRREMENTDRFVEDMKAQTGPGPLEQKLRALDGGTDPVSS